MSSIRVLTRLQTLDTELRTRRNIQEDIQRQLEDVAYLESLREQVATQRPTVASLENEQRSAEWEVEHIKQQVQTEETKLYGGSIRIPKELVSLQQEVGMLKARQQQHEDQLLGIMTQLEEQRGQLDQLTQELSQAEAERQALETQLGQQQQQLEAEIMEMSTQRGALAAQVPRVDMALYESLLAAKQGRAIARIERATCQGCRINLPMTVQQRVRSGQTLIQCPSCSRVLYMD